MAWDRKRLQQLIKERLGDEMFIVVSNREPYVHRFEGEEVVCEVPVSGLTIALDPVMRACGGLWVAHGSGDADQQAVDANDRVAVPPHSPSYMLRRVWLSKEEEKGYYYGFSNEGLWPLCHIAYTRPLFDADDWAMYKAVNQKFADVILQEVGDRKAFVFIQDYHFALLARMLKRPNIRTAQFWHIPWPNPEAFRICPWAEEVLDGLLGNDLLGFHIRFHCQNFLDTVDRMLEAKIDYEGSDVYRGGVKTMVEPFPIGVDFDGINEHSASPEVEQEIGKLRKKHGLRNNLIGLGVDRIDYTKGIPERMRAIDKMLDKHPDMHRKFTFVQIGVPSRVHIETYQRLNDEIDQLVESINWKYQSERWKPIVFLKQNVSPEGLHAWYRMASYCVVSSLHDGMNMVAKEFVAARIANDGVLILSRFTGAARELADAELVNPYAIDDVGEAMYRALIMNREDQEKRMRKLRAKVQTDNIYRWAGKVLSALFQLEFEEVA